MELWRSFRLVLPLNVMVFCMLCTPALAETAEQESEEASQLEPVELSAEYIETTVETAPPEVNQERLREGLLNTAFKPIRSLLVDKEMPLVGIRWGADIQADTPLNSEPDDATAKLRLARLVFYRSFGTEWSVKAQGSWDSEGHFEIGDAYFVYTGWKTMQATLGFRKPAYSLENMTSRLALTFMERALPVAALSDRRSAGISFLKRTTDSIWQGGVYLLSPDDEGQRENGQAIVLRYMHAPLDMPSETRSGRFNWRRVWSGISISYRGNASEDTTRFRSLPEVGTGDDYFVDTGNISGAEDILRVGLEANRVSGPFSWQAELLASRVRRQDAEDVFFHGGYFFASWFLTGETRNYNSADGKFTPVIPVEPVGHDGWGAWELALRASAVNLNDHDVYGGRQRNVSLGLNWYLNQQFRVQANIVKVLGVDRPGSEFDGENPWMGALRVQWSLR